MTSTYYGLNSLQMQVRDNSAHKAVRILAMGLAIYSRNNSTSNTKPYNLLLYG